MYLVHYFSRKPCNGSKKWSWLIQWMNWDFRHLRVVFQCRISFEVLDARIASTQNKIIVWRNKRPKKGTVSFAADRLLIWSTIAFGGHWEPWFCRKLHQPIHYRSSKWRHSGLRFQVGRNIFVYDENPACWHLGRIVQIKNTRVWQAQDRIGIVRPGDSSKEVRTWLSQIESYGEKKYRAGNSKLRILGSETEFWEERRGQESGDKTACTKNSWRLLAVGSQRAMCERRQLQFPPRYG